MNHSEVVVINISEWIALTVHSVPAIDGSSCVLNIRTRPNIILYDYLQNFSTSENSPKSSKTFAVFTEITAPFSNGEKRRISKRMKYASVMQFTFKKAQIVPLWVDEIWFNTLSFQT